MTKEKFERDFNIKVDRLVFAEHYSGLYDVAVCGRFTIYREKENQEYSVIMDNSVCMWRWDLSKECGII